MKNFVVIGIQTIMAQKGLIQKYVAERAGLTEQQFSDMLNGRKIIRVEHLPLIARALDVDVRDICDAGLEGQEEEGA